MRGTVVFSLAMPNQIAVPSREPQDRAKTALQTNMPAPISHRLTQVGDAHHACYVPYLHRFTGRKLCEVAELSGTSPPLGAMSRRTVAPADERVAKFRR
jgi:hypothetical protein